jgi:hypothetical protein
MRLALVENKLVENFVAVINVAASNGPYNSGGNDVFSAGRDAIDWLASIRSSSAFGPTGVSGLGKLTLRTK